MFAVKPPVRFRVHGNREAEMPRPRTGETPIRHVRVPDALWERVGEIARAQGRTISAVVLEALERHVEAHKKELERERS